MKLIIYSAFRQAYDFAVPEIHVLHPNYGEQAGLLAQVEGIHAELAMDFRFQSSKIFKDIREIWRI